MEDPEEQLQESLLALLLIYIIRLYALILCYTFCVKIHS